MPASLAQRAQQKILSSASTPWPVTRQPQCSQVGAIAWMAHSKLSNVRLSAPRTISKRLVVLVAANVAFGHRDFFRFARDSVPRSYPDE